MCEREGVCLCVIPQPRHACLVYVNAGMSHNVRSLFLVLVLLSRMMSCAVRVYGEWAHWARMHDGWLLSVGALCVTCESMSGERRLGGCLLL